MKKTILMTIMALMVGLNAFADDPEKSKDYVFQLADVMPEYPGGTVKMMKFLSDNVKYPEESAKRGEQGRVLVKFVVEKNGSLSNFVIMRNVTPSLDKAAIEVLKKMPKWKPGKVGGKKVRVYYTLPVTFKLN